MSRQITLDDLRVAIADMGNEPYPDPAAPAPISAALERATTALGWADAGRGPFGNCIPRGARVLVKPNWVLHRNEGRGGFEPLVTHASVISAVVTAALQAGASSVLVGDAPVQGCDFPKLMEASGTRRWAEPLRARDTRFLGVRDFRRTVATMRDGVLEAEAERISLDQFVLFDLGAESMLEPISDDRGSFRVTQYDPAQLALTHRSGRHQYLVAREVVEADVIINLPKLKTHKKAGLTCALKNLIGINGNKEYLPHHRVGGLDAGGDCYPGNSYVKRALEYAYDQLNSAKSHAARRSWAAGARVLDKTRRFGGDEVGVEGSWSGNDTIWRTCLDLNRIVQYGTSNGELADSPVRTVIHVVDALIAGQADGPLAPDPLPLGLLLVGASAPAIDWVGAHLLGYSPQRIRTTREAFGTFRWPLVAEDAGPVTVVGDRGSGIADDMVSLRPSGPITYPAGWRDAVAPRPGDSGSAEQPG